MNVFVDHPAVLFAVLLALFIGAVAFGAFVLRRLAVLPPDDRDDCNIIQTSTLTLLALLVGFSLSMAVNRYDVRESLEESEANAIGTEYARADLVDSAVGAITILPATVALSLALIADIDSPKGGVIRVELRDLGRLLTSLEP
ncbi:MULTISPECIES: hypothetical protein [unclassified Caballeronia]|uniref:hypothetical protein n=1 Tax=unclassified Caballeronia TaxID=2646786 RepID=UPI0028626385|nr:MULTISPECIES: hypothetical protein [unclassified Caballeronia]MDR5818707.1 hypothetical protein [Caballeronia sp. LZ033]MDR5822693.1 hypothetical protein [Caballeronia sp. LZ043]MDR5879902.1 hypothetical protein [Caballeronia sp. LZ032]